MRFAVLFYCMLIAALLQAQDTNLDDSAPLLFKTRTQSMTSKYHFKIESGKILFRKIDQRSWTLFNGSGTPFDQTESIAREIVEISADGENLIAIDEQQQVYYTKIAKVKWQKKWGKPIAHILKLQDNLAWGISHRGPYMQYYSDIHGNDHPIFAGVSTLYLLRKNGHEIVYVDPWLPAVWYHQVDMPDSGRMVAVNMSVSGSTLFIINAAGEMFTRLYDYDTSGQNPILPYSYENDKRDGTRKIIRSLPPEPWRQQPAIKSGLITQKITILQTGEKGNGAFELRVEGVNGQGMTGYYTKRIYKDEWQFVATGQQIQGKLINLGQDYERELSPIKTKNYSGKIWLKNMQISAQLLGCSPIIPPAILRLSLGDKKYDLKLHMRRYKYQKSALKFKATLEVSEELIKSTDSAAKTIWQDLFRQEKFIDFHAEIEDGKFESVENLHQVGIDKLADILTWKLGYKFSKILLKAKYHRRIRMSFSENKN